jgi:hypothetical protein
VQGGEVGRERAEEGGEEDGGGYLRGGEGHHCKGKEEE